jgi:predicted nucleic acid-binding protein
MKYLLDTNVISEHRKSNCNLNVAAFMKKVQNENVFLSTITIGEIVHGINREIAKEKQEKLSVWLNGLLNLYENRILSFDITVASEWGRLRAHHKRTLPVMDSLLAATAMAHHLTLVTRNTKDFESITGIALINPFL